MITLGAYGEDMDFYAMKGAIEALLKDLRVEDVRFTGPSGAPSDASYHPGRCACVWSGGELLGIFGQVHPLAAQNYDVDGALYCGELSFEALCRAKGAGAEYMPLPKFPGGAGYRGGVQGGCHRRGAHGLHPQGRGKAPQGYGALRYLPGARCGRGEQERGVQPDAPVGRAVHHRGGGG